MQIQRGHAGMIGMPKLQIVTQWPVGPIVVSGLPGQQALIGQNDIAPGKATLEIEVNAQLGQHVLISRQPIVQERHGGACGQVRGFDVMKTGHEGTTAILDGRPRGGHKP